LKNISTVILTQILGGYTVPYFETKKHSVFSPENPTLTHFYSLLEKYAPVIGDSPLFDDLVDLYHTLDQDIDDGIYEEGGEKVESV
jgi:hypothetical protein